MLEKCCLCSKKRQLFDCKCNQHMCLNCMSEHKCTYDYKKENRERLSTELTKIVAPKITQIA